MIEKALQHDPEDDDWWFHIPNAGCFTNGFDHNFCKKVIRKVRPKTALEWYCFLWSAKVVVLNRFIDKGAKILPVKYDSLLENKRETVAKLFSYLNISAENVDVACEALNYDSQAGVAMVSWESRRKGDALNWSKDADVVRRCNMILEAFHLPDLSTTLTFANSI